MFENTLFLKAKNNCVLTKVTNHGGSKKVQLFKSLVFQKPEGYQKGCQGTAKHMTCILERKFWTRKTCWNLVRKKSLNHLNHIIKEDRRFQEV